MPKIKKDFRWKNKFVSEKVYKQRISQTKNGQNISDNRAAKHLTEEEKNVESNQLIFYQIIFYKL